jgi:hypothetical protein
MNPPNGAARIRSCTQTPHILLKELHLSTPFRFQGKPGGGQGQRKARGRNPVSPSPNLLQRNHSRPGPNVPSPQRKTARNTIRPGARPPNAGHTDAGTLSRSVSGKNTSAYAETAQTPQFQARSGAQPALKNTAKPTGATTPNQKYLLGQQVMPVQP